MNGHIVSQIRENISQMKSVEQVAKNVLLRVKDPAAIRDEIRNILGPDIMHEVEEYETFAVTPHRVTGKEILETIEFDSPMPDRAKAIEQCQAEVVRSVVRGITLVGEKTNSHHRKFEKMRKKLAFDFDWEEPLSKSDE